MADPLERLVNLALFLGSSTTPVTAEDVRTNVEGYPAEQDETSFRRMFERDKDDLRSAGFVIVSDGDSRYRLDPAATFASQITFTAAESATIRAVGSAFLGDVSFPFADDLRLALIKLAANVSDDQTPVTSRLAEEQPSQQGALVTLLAGAITARKRVDFDYVNAAGVGKHHCVEPYGLFVRDGRWYLAGRDCDRDEIRVYAVTRAESLEANATRPKTPDFERPEEFDVRTFIALPFQYGAECFEASIAFAPSQAWRASSVTAGIGSLAQREDGSTVWIVTARDGRRLLRWIIENGPGLSLIDPPRLAEELSQGLVRVASAHG